MAIRELISAVSNQGVITTDRFVGRENLLEDLVEFFYESEIGKNWTINGLSRVGKTSLVRRAASLYHSSKSFNRNHILVYIDLNADCRNKSISFVYSWIVSRVFAKIAEGQKESRLIGEDDFSLLQELKDKIRDTESPYLREDVLLFFNCCKNCGLRIRLVLDEFDSILKNCQTEGKLNEEELNAFYAGLRSIITDNDNYSLKVALVSRNELSEMEPPGVESKLSGVCDSTTLLPFKPKELKLYWKRLKSVDDTGFITEDYMDYVVSFAGGIPYWLDIVNSVLMQGAYREETEEEISFKLYNRICKEYQSILRMLDDSRYVDRGGGSLKSKFLQVMVGPKFDVKIDDISKLMAYSIITKKRENDVVYYSTLSPEFEDYLIHVPLDTPIWETIHIFEKKVRLLIKERFLDNFTDWESLYEERYGSGLVPRLRDARKKTMKLLGNTADSHLVDYLYMSDYYTFFFKPYWEWFRDVFKSFNGDCNLLKKHMEFLCGVRNPLAHSNDQFLSKNDIEKTNEYCISLIKQIDSYMDS